MPLLYESTQGYCCSLSVAVTAMTMTMSSRRVHRNTRWQATTRHYRHLHPARLVVFRCVHGEAVAQGRLPFGFGSVAGRDVGTEFSRAGRALAQFECAPCPSGPIPHPPSIHTCPALSAFSSRYAHPLACTQGAARNWRSSWSRRLRARRGGGRDRRVAARRRCAAPTRAARAPSDTGPR